MTRSVYNDMQHRWLTAQFPGQRPTFYTAKKERKLNYSSHTNVTANQKKILKKTILWTKTMTVHTIAALIATLPLPQMDTPSKFRKSYDLSWCPKNKLAIGNEFFNNNRTVFLIFWGDW